MLDKRKSRQHTCRATTAMSTARQASETALAESSENEELMRLAQKIAKDPAVIEQLKASDQDVKRGRVFSSGQAMKRLKRKRALARR